MSVITTADLTSFIISLVLLPFSLCTVITSSTSLYPGFSGTDGWSVSGQYCNQSNCAGNILLGGYGCFGSGTSVSQTFTVAHHWQISIMLYLWQLDYWYGDTLYVSVPGNTYSYTRYYWDQNYGDFCGNGYVDFYQYFSTTISSHYSRSVPISFSSSQYYDPYTESWGLSQFQLQYQPCNPTCNQCQGQDAYLCLNCWANAVFVPYSGGMGFCQCNTGYYALSSNIPCYDAVCSQCLACDSSCLTCTSGDQYSCIQCQSGKYLQYYGAVEVNNNLSDPRYQKSLCQSSCVSTNYYPDPVSGNCIACYSTCATCNGGLAVDCLTCQSGYYLDGVSQGQCTTTCSPSYYKDDATKTCKACNSNCLYCLQNQPNFCSQCVNGSYLTIGTGVCVSDCGVGQWGRSSDWTCQYCDSTCQNCVSSATKCTSCTGSLYLYNNQCLAVCPDGYYQGASNTCMPCDHSCLTCNQATNTDCLSCSPSYGFLKSGQCIQCPNQFYGDTSNQTCQPCDTSCFNCRAGTSSDCVSCSTNYLQNYQCVPLCSDGYWGNSSTHTCDQCDSNCLTCQPYGPSINCLSCSAPLYLKNLRCITACNPVGEYGDNSTRVCTPCDSTCYECNQQNNNNCTQCTGSLQLYSNQCLPTCPSSPSMYGLNNVCIATCPDGMYADTPTRLCQPCNSICPTCFGSDTASCNSCASPYYLEGSTCQTFCASNEYENNSNRQCNPCNTNCLTCNGGADTNCTSCDPVKYLGNNQCYVSCPAPYFSNTVDMDCVLKCPNGYWGDVNDPSRLCKPCHVQCDLCFGGLFSQCSKCAANFYLFQTTCDTCPIGYFAISVTGLCLPCFAACQSCNGPSLTNCLSCNTGFYYLPAQTRCYDICPTPYFSHFTQPNCLLTCPTNYSSPLYGDPITRTCQNCNVACLQCTAGTNLDCVGCASGYYQYDQNHSCIQTCPNGTYADTSSMKCLPCNSSCANCDGGLSTNCLSCLLPNVLYNSQCIYDCPSPLYKDEDLKECVADCTVAYPNKYADSNDKTCKYCNRYCSKCTGPLSTQCLACKVPYLKYNTSCLQYCIAGTYQDSNSKVSSSDNDCKTCDSNCATCYGPLSSNCVTCSSSLFLLSQNGSVQCLSDCPYLFISRSSDMTCQPCPTKTFFFNGECKACHYSCETCSGSFQNECIVCADTRGQNTNKQPLQGVCSCQSGYIETYKDLCDVAPSTVKGLSTSTQVFAVTGASTSAIIGLLGRNMFFIYNIIEISQFTSYFRYININYPLDLNTLFDQLYISQISTVGNINSQNSDTYNNSTSTGQRRFLETTAFDNTNFLFDLRGKNLPLWQSFFVLIVLNVVPWVFVGGLNLLVVYWKIKYNQSHLLEKVRCWTSFGFPIQMFLRTSMEAMLFIVLCFRQYSSVGTIDWIVSIYFLILIVSVIVAMIFQNTRNIRVDQYEQPIIYVKKIKNTQVADNQTEQVSMVYPHPFRTLWDFTKKDKVSRNYYLVYLLSKILLVIFVVEFVQSPSQQILSFAIVKSILFVTLAVIRPMINRWYNGVTILNEFLQAIISYLTYGCTISSESSQNKFGYAILTLILVLFIVNLIGAIVSLVFILRNLIMQLLRKYNKQEGNTSSDIVRNMKMTRLQNLQKTQRLDISSLMEDQSQQKESHRESMDNTSTVQMQKDNQDDFDHSKYVQNQSIDQMDQDNMFYFLDNKIIDEKSSDRRKKKSKRSSPKHKSNLNKKADESENKFLSSQRAKRLNLQQSELVKGDDDYGIEDGQPDIKDSSPTRRLSQNIQNERTQRMNGEIILNQQAYRTGQNQDADDLSDYMYNNQPAYSATPITQFISNTRTPNLPTGSPFPNNYPPISPIPNTELPISPIPKLLPPISLIPDTHFPVSPIPHQHNTPVSRITVEEETPTPYHNQQSNSSFPEQFKEIYPEKAQTQKLEDFLEQKSISIIQENRKEKQQTSQLQIIQNRGSLKIDEDDYSIQKIDIDSEGQQNNSKVISFLNQLTTNKFKNKKTQKKNIKY